jgi:hypothetical protein
MKTIELNELLAYPAHAVWEIISDITRSDWVPSVENITESGGVRSFSMDGIGEIREKILVNDPENMRLQYSAITTPNPIDHHLATIKLTEKDGKCSFTWTTEIAPEEVAPAVEQGMKISLDGLKQVLFNAA